MKIRNKTLVTMLIVFVLLLGALCTGYLLYRDANSGTPGDTQIAEIEDCDAEDFRHREADCGFVQTKAPVVVKTTKPAPAIKQQPVPKITRR